jgi:hypothetical protein
MTPVPGLLQPHLENVESSLSFPPARTVGRGAAWYLGDCHVHSVHSDGELNPEELGVRVETRQAHQYEVDHDPDHYVSGQVDEGVLARFARPAPLVVLAFHAHTLSAVK